MFLVKRLQRSNLEEKLNVVGCCIAIDILVAMPPSPEALVEWSFLLERKHVSYTSGGLVKLPIAWDR